MDQAESLRRLVLNVNQTERVDAQHDSRRGALIVVVGAEPRVGVTSTAIHLAASWRRRGMGGAAIDANWRAPALQRFVVGTANATLHDVVLGRKTIREAKVTGPGGLPFVLAGLDPSNDLGNVMPATALHDTALAMESDLCEPHYHGHADVFSPEVLAQIKYWANEQFVLVDGGLLCQSQPLIEQADHCLVVLPDDEESTLAAYLQIKQYATRMVAARTWLVCNRSADDRAATIDRVNRMIAASDECLNLELLFGGILPRDEGVQRRHEDGRLAPVDSPFSNGIDQLAGRLELERGAHLRPWSSVTLAS